MGMEKVGKKLSRRRFVQSSFQQRQRTHAIRAVDARIKRHEHQVNRLSTPAENESCIFDLRQI
jgi:hypothetical protein